MGCCPYSWLATGTTTKLVGWYPYFLHFRLRDSPLLALCILVCSTAVISGLQAQPIHSRIENLSSSEGRWVLPPSSSIIGCRNTSCIVDLKWDVNSYVVPKGGVVQLCNVTLVQASLLVQKDLVNGSSYVLPDDVFLPSFFSLEKGAGASLVNTTIVTNCSTIVHYADFLLTRLGVFQANLASDPTNSTKQREQLLWEHRFQFVPGRLHVALWNTNSVITRNVTFTCPMDDLQQLATTTSTNVANAGFPLVIQQVQSNDDLRLQLEALQAVASNVVLSVQRNLSLADTGLWSSSNGPGLITVNVTLVGLPWAETVIDLQDRLGVFKVVGNPALTFQNIVFTNFPLGPDDAAPWNFMPSAMWYVDPPRQRVMSMVNRQGGNFTLTYRNCILEDVADLWLYLMSWSGTSLSGISNQPRVTFTTQQWNEMHVAPVGIGSLLEALISYCNVDTMNLYGVYLRLGSKRKYPANRNASGILKLTNNGAVPLDAVKVARDSNSFVLATVTVATSTQPQVAVWLMKPIDISEGLVHKGTQGQGGATDMLGDDITVASKKVYVFGYLSSQILSWDDSILTQLPLQGPVQIDSVVLLNGPTALATSPTDWRLLQSSLAVMTATYWPYILFTIRNTVLVVSKDELRFLKDWAQQLDLMPALIKGNDTLVYATLRKFGYDGSNITITSRCPEDMVCRPSNIAYRQLVKLYLGQDVVDGSGSDTLFSPSTPLFNASRAPMPSAGSDSSGSQSSSDISGGATIAIVVSCVVGAALIALATGLAVGLRMAQSRGNRPRDSTDGMRSSSKATLAFKSVEPHYDHMPDVTASPFNTTTSTHVPNVFLTPTRNFEALMHIHKQLGNSHSTDMHGSVQLVMAAAGGGAQHRVLRHTAAAGDVSVSLDACEAGSSTMQLERVLYPKEGSSFGYHSNEHMGIKLGSHSTARTKALLRRSGGIGLVSDMVSRLTHIEDENLAFQELLGRGGTASVYKATWRGLTVAVKMILLPGGETQMLEKAAQEVAMLLKLSHRNIVAIYSYQVRVITADDSRSPLSCCTSQTSRNSGGANASESSCMASMDLKVFIIQEFCNAGTLQAAIDGGSLAAAHSEGLCDALTLALDIANGMAYVHERNIVHGDLTPNNVLLQQSSTSASSRMSLEAKVADFGLAVSLGVGQTHVTRNVQGTTHYIAPEVFISGCTSKPADVYAFGVILWELVHGTPPWRRDDEDQAAALAGPYNEDEGSVLRPSPSCNPQVAEILTLCLQPDPSLRPTFQQVAQKLKAAGAQSRVAAEGEALLSASMTTPA